MPLCLSTWNDVQSFVLKSNFIFKKVDQTFQANLEHKTVVAVSSTAFKDIQDDYFWTKKHKSTVPLQKNIQTPTIYITAQYLLHRIKTNGKNVISCFKQTAAFPWFSQTKKTYFNVDYFTRQVASGIAT